jgi:hypothetical protein
VDIASNDSPKLIPIDEEPDDEHCQVVGDDMVTRQQQALSGGISADPTLGRVPAHCG